MLRRILAALSCCAALITALPAAAQEVLAIGTSNPDQHPIVTRILGPWAEAVNAEFEKIMQAFAKLPAPTAIPAGGGAPNYTHRAYADSADGTANFTTGAAGDRSYIGFAVNQISPTPSSNPEDYEWARLRGADGEDGAAGNDGEDGAPGANGRRTEFRFIRSPSPPPQAVGNVPPGTTLEIEISNLPVWVTLAERDGDGSLLSPWSPWVRLSPYPDPAPFDSATTYYEGQQVLFNGGTYILTAASSTGVAPSGTAQPSGVWGVVAAPGGIGAPATPPSAFTATIDLTSTSAGHNLRSIAEANGYTGMSDATITFRVPSGVTISGAQGASGAGGPGIDTGTWPTSSHAIALSLVIQNGGIVNGGGGRGGGGGTGRAGTVGGAGGDGVFQRVNMTAITVDAGGILRGGGGGGGGGTGQSERTFVGEELILAGSGGGGGGGGAPNGVGGEGGFALSSDTLATAGSAGSGTGGGAGGAGLADAGLTATAGGNGGGFATAGSASGSVGGGAAGQAVRRNGFTSTFTNNGTTVGVVS